MCKIGEKDIHGIHEMPRKYQGVHVYREIPCPVT